MRRILISYLFLLIISLHFFSACSELSSFDERAINQELADSLLGVTMSKDVTANIILDGYLRVKAESPAARTVENEIESYTRFIGPTVFVTVFDSTGAVETEITSHEMIYHGSSSRFQFEGDVFVRTSENRTIRSEQLEWNEISKQISGPGFVIITSPSDSITGYGFVGDEDLIRYRLQRVTGEFSIE